MSIAHPQPDEHLSSPRGRHEVFAAADAVHSVILSTAAVWIGITFAGLLLLVTKSVPSLSYPKVTAAALLAVAVTWLMCLVLRRWPPGVLVAVACAGALGSTLTSAPVVATAVFPITAIWLQLAVTTAAVLLPRISAAVVVLSVTFTGFFIMWFRIPEPSSYGWDIFVLAFDATAIGMAISAGISGMRDVATQTDVEAALEAQRRADVVAARAQADEEFRWACLVHDTAINTLGSVAAGLPAETAPLAARRAAADLTALSARAPYGGARSVESSSAHYQPLVDYAQERASKSGLTLTVEYEAAPTPLPLENVCEALRECICESLLNISKHSGVTTATLRIVERADGVSVVISDKGAGFDSTVTLENKPVRIATRAERVGVFARIDSRPGKGTRVHLSWTATPQVPGDHSKQPRVLVNALTPMVVSVTAWLFTLYAVETAVLQTGTGRVLTGLALVTSVVCVAVMIHYVKRTRAVPVAVTVAVLLLLPFVTLAPALDLAGCAVAGPQFWGPNCGVVLVAIVVLLVNRWWASTLAVLLYMGPVLIIVFSTHFSPTPCGDSGFVRTLTNSGIVVAVLLFRRYLQTYGRRYEQMLALAASEEAERIRFHTFATVRFRRAQTMLGVATALLADIAAGAPVDDPVLRSKCAAEESFLRAMLNVPPQLADLGDALAAAAQTGREHGIPVTIRISPFLTDTPPVSATALTHQLQSTIESGRESGASSVSADVHPDNEQGVTVTITTLHATGPETVSVVVCPTMETIDI